MFLFGIWKKGEQLHFLCTPTTRICALLDPTGGRAKHLGKAHRFEQGCAMFLAVDVPDRPTCSSAATDLAPRHSEVSTNAVSENRQVDGHYCDVEFGVVAVYSSASPWMWSEPGFCYPCYSRGLLLSLL
jgi:hypothetical protein